MKFTIIKSCLARFSGIFALGTPSNIHGTAIRYRCTKFGAFVNSVTILTLERQYLQFTVIFKTLSIGPVLGIESTTTRSTVKRSISNFKIHYGEALVRQKCERLLPVTSLVVVQASFPAVGRLCGTANTPS